jgi:hypothetical protein
MADYKKVNLTHKLSLYEVKLPYWRGTENVRIPFKDWNSGYSPNWFRAYNKSKHDRLGEFKQATFRTLTDAICGLVAILSSQFYTIDFSPSENGIGVGGHNDGMESAISN